MTPNQARKLTEEVRLLRVAVEEAVDRLSVALSKVA